MASGTSYQDYLRTEILEPAEMTHTGWWGDDPALKGQPSATGYDDRAAKGTIAGLAGPFWGLMGAGGIVSSVDDLYRWHAAMQQGKILSKESLEAFSTVQFPVDEGRGAGYGWVVAKDQFGHRVRAHAGGTAEIGHNNVMRWYIDDDILLIASSSNDAVKAEDVMPNLVKIVFERPYQLPPKTVTIESSVLDQYVGTYQVAEADTITVSREGDKLLLTGEGQQAFDMLFPPDPRIDVRAAETAVVNYLNAQRDGQLEQ
jgi:CubicO group peptidase (beta-lactamase class C family)